MTPAIGQRVWYTDKQGRGHLAIVCGVHYIRDEVTTVNLAIHMDAPVLYNVPYSPEYAPHSFHPVAPQSRAPHHSCGPTMRERARDENAWRKRRREMGWPVDGRGHRPVGPIEGPPPGEPLLAQHPQVSPPSGMRDAQGNAYPPAGGRLETPGGMPLELAHQIARREPEMSDVSPKPDPERHVQEERERQYAESLHDKDTRIAQLASYLEKNTAVMAQDAETIRSLQDKLRHPVSSRPVLAHHIDWESLYLTDGGGGGEPDTISLGHDAEGTWRSVEIESYQGQDAREHLEYVLKVARGIGAALEALLGE